MPSFPTMEDANAYIAAHTQEGITFHVKFDPMTGDFVVTTLFAPTGAPLQHFEAPTEPREEFAHGGIETFGAQPPPPPEPIIQPAPERQEPLISREQLVMPGLPTLRDFQEDAVTTSEQHPHTLIVIPTGLGKTEVALHIANALQIPTIVITPQITLVDQWLARIRRYGGKATGVSSAMDGRSMFSDFTVTTYASALLHLPEVLRYRLVIFDEVHHLFSPENRSILNAILSLTETTRIIGLTASPREYGYEKELQDRIFTNRYVLTPRAVRHTEYAVPLEVKSIGIYLSNEDQEQYNLDWNIYKKVLKDFGGFTGMINATRNRDEKVRRHAYAGLNAYTRMKRMLSEYPAKIDEAARIIRDNPGQFIIFGDTIAMVDTIFGRLGADGINAIRIHSQLKRSPSERERVLNDLRTGVARVLVGANSIEEGLDLPDLNNAIFISVFSAGNRKIIQRTGRVLRPGAGKHVTIWIIYANGTVEVDHVTSIRELLGEKS